MSPKRSALASRSMKPKRSLRISTASSLRRAIQPNAPNLLTVDHEIVFEDPIPASAVKTRGMMAPSRDARVVSAVGVVLTAYDLEQAGERSVEQHSIRPVGQAGGGWGGEGPAPNSVLAQAPPSESKPVLVLSSRY
jgi:hypothetical protein